MTTPKKARQNAVASCNTTSAVFALLSVVGGVLMLWSLVNGFWVAAGVCLSGALSSYATGTLFQAIAVHLENLRGPDL